MPPGPMPAAPDSRRTPRTEDLAERRVAVGVHEILQRRDQEQEGVLEWCAVRQQQGHHVHELQRDVAAVPPACSPQTLQVPRERLRRAIVDGVRRHGIAREQRLALRGTESSLDRPLLGLATARGWLLQPGRHRADPDQTPQWTQASPCQTAKPPR